MVFPFKQPDLMNLERVGYLPGLLAGLVALLALGTVAHALVMSVRRRRRDLAVLKTLGFVRGQVSQTVAGQATTFALVAGLLGLPLGIAGGRWAWRVVAEQLGVATGPVVPAGSVLAIAIVALLVANLVAAGPGWPPRISSRLPYCTPSEHHRPDHRDTANGGTANRAHEPGQHGSADRGHDSRLAVLATAGTYQTADRAVSARLASSGAVRDRPHPFSRGQAD